MYLQIRGDNEREMASTCICQSSSANIEVLRDVYISTGFDVDGRALNISDCRNPFDTESWSNNSLSIDGGRRSKEEYKSRVSLGEHSEREKKIRSEMEAK